MPSAQVLAAEGGRAAQECAPVSLWNPASPASGASEDRLLEVLTASGPRWLQCSQVPPVRLAPDAVWQLPQLLRDLLELAHVVGLAELDEELLWLVDLRRFAPDPATDPLNRFAE
jgi:hypothetical protein